MFDHVQGHMWVADRKGADCVIADGLKDDPAMMQNRGANTQRQIQWQTRKGKYKGSLCKGSLGKCRWGRVF